MACLRHEESSSTSCSVGHALWACLLQYKERSRTPLEHVRRQSTKNSSYVYSVKPTILEVKPSNIYISTY